MQVYEITPQYHLVRLGNEEPLDRPEQVVRYMDGAFAAEPTVESVWVIALNTKFRPLGRVKISSGTLNSCLVHPREVFRAAIMASACSIVLVHNHPSGEANRQTGGGDEGHPHPGGSPSGATGPCRAASNGAGARDPLERAVERLGTGVADYLADRARRERPPAPSLRPLPTPRLNHEPGLER